MSYPYVVEVFSHGKVVDVHCADWETASTTYQKYMESLDKYGVYGVIYL